MCGCCVPWVEKVDVVVDLIEMRPVFRFVLSKKTQVRSVTPFFKVVFFKIACQSQRFRQGGCKQPNVRGRIGRNYWFACKANQAYANLDNLFVTSARPRKTSNRPSWKSSALVCLPASIWAWAGTSPLAHFPEQASDSHRPTSHELLYWSSLQKFQNNKNTDSKCKWTYRRERRAKTLSRR